MLVNVLVFHFYPIALSGTSPPPSLRLNERCSHRFLPSCFCQSEIIPALRVHFFLFDTPKAGHKIRRGGGGQSMRAPPREQVSCRRCLCRRLDDEQAASNSLLSSLIMSLLTRTTGSSRYDQVRQPASARIKAERARPAKMKMMADSNETRRFSCLPQSTELQGQGRTSGITFQQQQLRRPPLNRAGSLPRGGGCRTSLAWLK